MIVNFMEAAEAYTYFMHLYFDKRLPALKTTGSGTNNELIKYIKDNLPHR